MSPIEKPIDISKPLPARRIELQYSNEGWNIVSEKKVAKKRIPIHHPYPHLTEGIELAGTWFEVVDNDGVIIYRRRVWMPGNTEAFDEKGVPFIQNLSAREWGTLELLIPDLPEAKIVRLFSIPMRSMKDTFTQPGLSRVPVFEFELGSEDEVGGR